MSLSAYQVSYQISPIILVGGIAGAGALPIVSVLNSQNYNLGILSSSNPQQIEELFGQFKLLSGGSLLKNEVATFPLASMAVAANALISDALSISLEMQVPAGNITLANRQAVMTGLKSTLDSHTALGGWYNVATPAYIYQGCLLTQLVDVSDDEPGMQSQVKWRWDFYQPLITAAQAQAAQNQAMAKITGQTQNSGDPPGSQPVSTAIGQPSSNIVQNIIPAAAGPIGSNVAPSSGAANLSGLQAVSPVLPGG